jgi:hypothetical protein
LDFIPNVDHLIALQAKSQAKLVERLEGGRYPLRVSEAVMETAKMSKRWQLKHADKVAMYERWHSYFHFAPCLWSRQCPVIADGSITAF